MSTIGIKHLTLLKTMSDCRIMRLLISYFAVWISGHQRPDLLLSPLTVSDVEAAQKFAHPYFADQLSMETTVNHGTKRVQILVRDNNVDQALKALKKKMQREGIFREMKLRNHFEKPSEKRVRAKAEAIRRARKLARKLAQKEGLMQAGGRR